MENSLCSD